MGATLVTTTENVAIFTHTAWFFVFGSNNNKQVRGTKQVSNLRKEKGSNFFGCTYGRDSHGVRA